MSPPCTRTTPPASNRQDHPHGPRPGALRHLAAALALLAGTAHATTGAPDTLEDRIACQTALDEVRWSHTIWPDVNPGPKPPRADVIPDASIRAKVLDQLRKEQALFGRYGERIDTAALQAELDRMARETRAPDQLRDLYAALDNDAYTVAACLAKPSVVDRRLRKRYATDDALHAYVHARAAAALANADVAFPGKGELPVAADDDGAAHIATLTYLRVDDPARHASEQLAASGDAASASRDIALDPTEWNALLHRLDRSAARQMATGTPHFEDTDTALVHRVVLERSAHHLVLQVAHWGKRDFDAWWRSEAPRWSARALPNAAAVVSANLTLTPVQSPRSVNAKGYQPGDVMPDDTWRTEDAPKGRQDQTAIWTGSEMIVWGGAIGKGYALNSGGRFDPGTNQWRSTAALNAPSARYEHTAVWTGTSMLIWGGFGNDGLEASGASYDPSTDTWAALPLAGSTPSARYNHTAIWTGSDMIAWGGSTSQGVTNTGGRYNPTTKLWTPTRTDAAPVARAAHAAVWTGNRMIVWGGVDDSNDLMASGGIFDPATPQGSWQPTPSLNAPSVRVGHTAVWARGPQSMIVWGGSGPLNLSNSGAKLVHTGNSWAWQATVLNSDTPTPRRDHTAVWTGERMIVFGGEGPNVGADGASYDPVSDAWALIPAVGNIDGEVDSVEGHTAVWAGNPDAPSASDRMVVWGGRINGGVDARTLSYAPAAPGAWTIIGQRSPPVSRKDHTSVWTGTEMLIWGGRDGTGNPAQIGVRYVAATGAWLPLQAPNVVEWREHHSAVWTGIDLFIWGGLNFHGNARQYGARYNPLLGESGEWVEPASTSVGPPRARHEAVWTGDRMIVWGGYRPDTDTWHGTGLELFPGTGNQPSTGSILQPPDQRTRRHFSLTWAPERGEVLLWGGQNADGSIVHADGWRYNPVTKASVTIAASNPGRYGHEAVWTGNSLLIAGGLEKSKPADTAITYFPAQAAWATSKLPTEPRIFHSLVWTGTQALAWGGLGASNLLASGERIAPPATPQQPGSVTPMSLVDAPLPRMQHTAVWSDERMEMLVWGGQGQGGFPLANLGVYSASGVGKPTPIFADGFE